MSVRTNGTIRRIAKPSARELFDHKHQAIDLDEKTTRLCACIVMHDHYEKETIYG